MNLVASLSGDLPPPGYSSCWTANFDLPDSSALAVRRPGRFANVAVGEHQPLSHATVGRHCVEHAARTFTGGIEDHAAVRGEARRFVQPARGEQSGFALPAECAVQNRNTIHIS